MDLITFSVPRHCAKPPLRCRQAGESAVEVDGEQLTIRHILTVSVEFANEKYNERDRGANNLS